MEKTWKLGNTKGWPCESKLKNTKVGPATALMLLPAPAAVLARVLGDWRAVPL